MEFNFNVLSEKAKQTFSILEKQPFLENFYLAGGTALALQIGHRISIDLDFFTEKDFSEADLAEKLSHLGEFFLEKKAENSLIGTIDAVKLSFLGYKYPLLRPLKKISLINAADILDIACMKIDAIASRGTKRDFIDVYFIVKNFYPLLEILKQFEIKYSAVNYNMVHVKKSLVFFEDAEIDPMPQMLAQVSWEEVRKFFENEVERLRAD